jgi:hypothetical protein
MHAVLPSLAASIRGVVPVLLHAARTWLPGACCCSISIISMSRSTANISGILPSLEHGLHQRAAAESIMHAIHGRSNWGKLW